MKKVITLCLLFLIAYQSISAQNPSISGNVWIDEDGDNAFFFEQGLNGIKVDLISFDTNEIVDSVVTEDFEFNFPSMGGSPLISGEYYIEVNIEDFIFSGLKSCPGALDANDGVDNDDNGIEGSPVVSTPFTLDTSHVDYVDICLTFDCEEEVLEASFACEDINETDIFCSITELDAICGVMPVDNSPGNQPNPLCLDGGGTHNISWFAFIADEGDYSVTVTPTGCTGSSIGQEGVQMGLYTDCTFTETVFCESECSTDPVTFDSDLLIPGATYYFFIDGCANSVCAYEISVSGVPIPYDLSIDEVCIVNDGNLICEDSEFCADTEILFKADNQDLIGTYSWSITTLSGGPYAEDASPTTQENNIGLVFNNEGIYSICLDSVENSCTEWIGSVCKTITITEGGVEDEVFNPVNICVDLISDFDPSVLDDQDPNGDGVFGWVDTAFAFSFGENISVISDSIFCAYEQSIFISPIDNAELVLDASADTICLGESIQFMLSTNEDFDSIIWSVNDVIQIDSIDSLTPEDIGNYTVLATIFNSCGSSADTVTFQVLDNVSAPFVSCDSFGIGEVIFTWPEVEGVQGYSISINGGSIIEVTDTFYVVEGLAPSEVVSLEFNVIDLSKCVGPAINLECIAPDIVNVTEDESNDIKLVPNPTSDYLTIEGDFITINATYRIYSIDGSLMKIGNLSDNRRVDVMNLPTGLYIIMLGQKDDGKNWIERFVKQ